jgi:uncharacterized protein DUF1131
MKVSLSIALLSVTVSACGGGAEPPDVQEANPPQAVENEAPEDADELLLTDAGLDGYPAGSSFNLDLLRGAVPGHDVREAEATSEGMSWTVFIVEKDGQEVLEIGPDPMGSRVGVIHTDSPSVATDTGYRVGSRFSDIYAGTEAECEAGMEEMSGTVLCAVPDRVQFYYRFEGTFEGPDGEVPPRDVLESWVVSSVVWSIY